MPKRSNFLISQILGNNTHSIYSQGDDPMMQSFYVGNFCEPPELAPEPPAPNAGPIIQGYSSPLIDLERNLALFLGLFNHTLYKSLPLDQDEV